VRQTARISIALMISIVADAHNDLTYFCTHKTAHSSNGHRNERTDTSHTSHSSPFATLLNSLPMQFSGQAIQTLRSIKVTNLANVHCYSSKLNMAVLFTLSVPRARLEYELQTA
jgi:hypothetical protein